MLPLAEQHILNLDPYIPGRPKPHNRAGEMIPFWAKMGSNENCLGASPLALDAARKALRDGHMYPLADPHLLKELICERFSSYSVRSENVALGNGSTELIVLLVRALLGPGQSVLNAWPTFIMYRLAAQSHGRTEINAPLNARDEYDLGAMAEFFQKKGHQTIKMIFIANPNNPTGTYVKKKALQDFLEQIPEDVAVVFDEAYAEYVTLKDYPHGVEYAMKRPRTFVLRTFSKIYGLAGLRIGYGIGDSSMVSLLQKLRDPFSVNVVAQEAAKAALLDQAHVEKSRQHVLRRRPLLAEHLRNLGFFVTPGVGNFLCIKRASFMPSVPVIAQLLLEQGVIVRTLPNYDLPDCIRVTVGTDEENILLMESLKRFLL